MYLSYSGFKKHAECNSAYYFGYIGKPALPPENRVNMLYGSVVGTVFEDFYDKKIWRQNPTTLVDTLTSMVEPTLQKIMRHESGRGGIFRWKAQDRKSNYESREDLIADIKAAIPRGLEIIRQHKLIGTDARAEVKLDTTIRGHILGGRADFIMRRSFAPENDLVILDGKGSRWRDKYVDERQLYWYAKLYEKHNNVLPDRLGFVFWRYEPDKAIDWIEVTRENVDKFEHDVLETIDNIEAAKRRLPMAAKWQDEFPAMPDDKKCGLCSYLPMCEGGKAYFAEKEAKKKAKMGLPTSGVTDIGLDGIGLDED